MKHGPVRLRASFEEKIWGARSLAPWFPEASGKIGEVTFAEPEEGAPPVRVKFLFTSEKLSVQVHPSDEYAWRHEGQPGKDEMWYVLAAEPGARLAAGFREPLSRERARAAALTGEIEGLLQWWPVEAGQVYFVPAGTVHTLGAGIAVCEIQQPSPVTYRFYDYGRGRELHLERALDVAALDRYAGPSKGEGPLLASCAGFAVERLEIAGTALRAPAATPEVLVVVDGAGRMAGEAMTAGQVWHVPAGGEGIEIAAAPRASLLRAYIPGGGRA